MRVVEKAEQGELRRSVADYNRPLTLRQRRIKNQDPRTRVEFTRGTRAQIVWFHTSDGEFVAEAFQYRRPDGQLAGSGMADPKLLVLKDGRLMILERD